MDRVSSHVWGRADLYPALARIHISTQLLGIRLASCMEVSICPVVFGSLHMQVLLHEASLHSCSLLLTWHEHWRADTHERRPSWLVYLDLCLEDLPVNTGKRARP